MRVLVVDDEESLAVTLQANLELDGFEVDLAADGSAALALLQAQPYDLMLSDIKMPGMDGVELFRQARLAQPAMPVILMTGFAMEGLVKQAINEGVFTVFPKPFEITHLETVLNRALRRPTVLIVDGAGSVAEQTAKALRESGLRAHAACDAETAVQVVRQDTVDVCVLDLLLSNDDGVALLEEMKRAEPGILFIVVSGLGTVACLRKPLETTELLHAIARARRLPTSGTLERQS
jgi:DNA-binding NtrC family response regulator